VLVISIHEHPGYLYPGTGYPHEKGTGKGEDYTMNVAMMPGAQNDAYEAAMTDRVLPKLRWFRPQILLVSAGFDAAADDPLAHIELTRSYFTTITHRLIDAAEELCDGRLISVLEGGYNLDSLAHCAARHVCALAGKSDPGD
jgi:acetoin utilization deacetylase AcuC-like enzyme